MRNGSSDAFLVTFEDAFEDVGYREEEADESAEVDVGFEGFGIGVEDGGGVRLVERWEGEF